MCSHLIGVPYSYGCSTGGLDCIHLVVAALDSLGIDNPGIQPSWYGMGWRQVLRELQQYTNRVEHPAYDGDIVLLAGSRPAFGVTWQTGILYMNEWILKSDWKPVDSLLIRRCFRMKGI